MSADRRVRGCEEGALGGACPVDAAALRGRPGVELCPKLKARPAMIEEYAQTFMPSDERVDCDELVDILREAARARNGWKHISLKGHPDRGASCAMS
jgi:hypothetical protein